MSVGDIASRLGDTLPLLILCYIVFGAPSISLLREVIEVKKHCCIGYQTTAETMGLDLIERVQSYVLPLLYLMVAVYGQSWKVSILIELTSGAAGLVTIYDLIVIQGRPLIILNYSQWRDPMFERAWQVIGRFSSIPRAELHWTLS